MDVPLKKVAVVGGGLAGLSAASRLAEAGIDVTLFEAAPQLGGRARAVVWKGKRLDNGQHILLGAYQKTLELMASIGVNENHVLLRLPLALNMHSAFTLKTKNLAAPLHLLFGLLSAKGLNLDERFAAIRFFIWLKVTRFKLTKDEPLLSLLSRKHQPERLIKWLWEPLCLAALNTPIKTASAQTYLNVLRDSFNQSKTDSELLLPKVDLSTLLSDPIAAHIKKHGGKIALNTSVSNVEQTADGFSLKITSKQVLEFSHVLLACSPHHLQAITPELDIASDNAALNYQPIYTVYIQYPSHIKLPNIMTGFTQGIAQWAFDRGQLCGQDGLVAVIISAEGAHQKLSQQALNETITAELQVAFPYLPAPEWHKVIAEKRATFACTAGLKRPAQQSKIKNLYFAGDFTEGDYPATIEGAIRSGLSAAQLIMQS
jgi:squalene-associated FAD-dependent desaturase